MNQRFRTHRHAALARMPALLAVALAVGLSGTAARAGTAVYNNGWSGGGGSGGAPLASDNVVLEAGNLTWNTTLPSSVAS